jgi:hypothetical protein
MQIGQKGKEHQSHGENVFPLRNPGDGFDLNRMEAEEKSREESRPPVGKDFLNEEEHQRGVEKMKNHVVEMVPERLEVPDFVVQSIAQNLEGEVISHNRFRKDSEDPLPAQVTNVSISPHIIGVIEVNKGIGQAFVVDSEDGQEKKKNQEPIRGQVFR